MSLFRALLNQRLERIEADHAARRSRARGDKLLTSGPTRCQVSLVDGSRHAVGFGSPELVELCNHGTLGGVPAVDAEDFTTMPPEVKAGGIPGLA